MKTINLVVSDLCEDIDRLTAERDQWKAKYEECNKKFNDFVNSSIKNAEATSKNWLLYVLAEKPQPKKYKIAWESIVNHEKGGLLDTVFTSRFKCQQECDLLDVIWFGSRHWPEEV
jgi:hypothetical protein